jgi:hypothetical protein
MWVDYFTLRNLSNPWDAKKYDEGRVKDSLSKILFAEH